MRIFIAVILLVLTGESIAAEGPKTQGEQKVWEEQFDKQNIRHKTKTMIREESSALLIIPDAYDGKRNFTLAKTQPVVDFAIIQGLETEYLPWHLAKNAGGAWGGWGDVTKGPDGCYYFSISNHMSYGAESYVIKYDPVSKSHEIVLSAKDLCAWQPDDFGDGKIHGDIDFGPGGDTWMLTYFGPSPSEKEWDSIYRGSWLLKYNCFTGKAENLGIPLEGASWPYHNYDSANGLFFGVNHTGHNILIYDTKERKMIYGGAPPDNIRWYARCILIDRKNGDIYTSDSNTEDRQIIRYRRRNNEFTRMNARPPMNPNTGKNGDLRAHSSKKDTDGAYWCFDHHGTVFTFNPSLDKTEYKGENWGDKGSYTANLAMSPGGRYLYYVPGHLSIMPAGTPVVQYDTKTGKRKVLAFLFDYFMEKYGYAPVRCYGIELDEKGESIVFYANGGFADPDDKNPYAIKMRRPAVFQVHIPASERIE